MKFKLIFFVYVVFLYIFAFGSPVKEMLAGKNQIFEEDSSAIKEVEYLESTGTQYIDTGFKANTHTTHLAISIEFTNTTIAQGVFGSRNKNTGDITSCNAFIMNANIFRPDWAQGSGSSSGNISILTNTVYEMLITRGTLVINGYLRDYETQSSVDQYYNFLLFNFMNAGSPYKTGLYGKVRYAQIYSDSILVRNFIPVRFTNEDGVSDGAMFDTVTGELFRNIGSGDFIIGPDKE